MKTDNTVLSAEMISLKDLARQLEEEMRPVTITKGVDLLASEHFVSIVRGRARIQRGVDRRRCRIDLRIQGEPETDQPKGAYGSLGLGWLDTLEVILLHVGSRTLTWKRKGKHVEIFVDEAEVARANLSLSLEYLHVGSGSVSWDGVPFFKFTLPLRKPSSPQGSDCEGSFRFDLDEKVIKFLISPKEAKGADGTTPGVAAAKRQSNETIFYPSDEAYLARLSNDQRLLLLALAIWPWSIY